MPQSEGFENINSDEVQDIITAVPSWILRWGTIIVLSILITILFFSSLIRYPDTIKTSLKVNSVNSPKEILARKNGKLFKLLVADGDLVEKNQHLALMETTANVADILKINKTLKNLREFIINHTGQTEQLPSKLNLGELQSGYQELYQQYLQYSSTLKNGFYLKRIALLENDLVGIKGMEKQIIVQESIQKQEFTNQLEEYKAYQGLFTKKVISRSEFVQQENKFLASKYPLQQTKTSLLNNAATYGEKQKELLEIKQTIFDENAKFMQALNSYINEIDDWFMNNLLRAPIAGKVIFAGIVEANQNVTANQELFVVDPGSNKFFGEVKIPQYNMGKIRMGENVLVKLQSYPYEQYGLIRGRLSQISDVAFKDSVFIAMVTFERIENKDQQHKIVLKNGMMADVEIITEESSLLQRIFRNISKVIKTN